MSELNSFGSVLSFAIEMEGALRDYYLATGHDALSAEAVKRREKLERVRRENVVEITLEPIDGLNAADYSLNFSAGTAAVEASAARFYLDAAPKINVRSAQRALEQCAKQHQELAG
jgi:hypothetical protein